MVFRKIVEQSKKVDELEQQLQASSNIFSAFSKLLKATTKNSTNKEKQSPNKRKSASNEQTTTLDEKMVDDNTRQNERQDNANSSNEDEQPLSKKRKIGATNEESPVVQEPITNIQEIEKSNWSIFCIVFDSIWKQKRGWNKIKNSWYWEDLKLEKSWPTMY